MDFLPEFTPVLGVISSTIAAIAAITAAVTSVAGGVMTAVSSVQQGKASEDAAKYNAEVAQNDAIAAQNAAAAQARQIRRQNLLRLGAQRADIAKSGVSLDAGSSFDDVIYDSAIQGELEAQSAIYTGLVRSQAQQAAGAMALYEGRQAKRAAGIGAASGAIGAIGGVAQVGLAAYPMLGKKTPSGPVFEAGKPGFPEM